MIRRCAVFAACCLAILVLAVFAPSATACSCVAPGPPQQEMEAADAVFTARVVSAEAAEQRTGDFRLQRMKVALELDRVWKGCAEGDEVVLWTGLGGGDCGYGFEAGKRYLIYAYETDDGALTTSICSRTRPLERAQEDFAALGEPQRTVEPSEE